MKSDVKLQQDVLAELDWEPSLDAAQIGVTVRDGVVTLGGHVSVYSAKLAAEEVVKRVHGVTAVANDIEVRPAGAEHLDDADIAAAAVHVLQWDAGVPDDRVQVTVRDRRVVLDGTVDRRHERVAAERAVRHLKGVRGVTNHIAVRPAGGSGAPRHALRDDIQAALRRSAALTSGRVSVDMDGHRVTLLGDVHSPAQRDEAERIAWAARDVATVENCITITPWGAGPAEEWGY